MTKEEFLERLNNRNSETDPTPVPPPVLDGFDSDFIKRLRVVNG